MKFSEAKTTIMQLINMYSERGVVFSSNDKNVSDFDLKARNYLNIALKTVSNKFPITKNISITKVSSDDEQEPVAMPTNFLRLEKLYKLVDDDVEEYTHFYWVDDTHLALPNKESGTFKIKYSAISDEIPSSASSNYELDIQKALENAVCYYAAATLIQAERPEIATRLYEQYTELMYTYTPTKQYQRKIKRV